MISAEDLTEEIQHIMMNESVPSWINEWQDQVESPWLESSIFPHTIEDLFGGDEIATGLYDEMTFYPTDDSPVLTSPDMSPPSLSASVSVSEVSHDGLAVVDIDNAQDILSESESSDSDDEEEEEDPVLIARSVNAASAPVFDGSDSEDEDQFIYQKAYASRANNPTPVASFMQRRQMEESILEKITTQLDAEKLPAILTIIGSHQDQQAHGGEVEIDLTRLDQDRLGRILAYVDACVLEQQGGPSVDLSNFLTPVAVKVETKKPQRKSRARPADSDDESDDSQVYDQPKRRRRRTQAPARKRSRKQARKVKHDMVGGNTVVVDELALGVAGSIMDGPVSISTLSSVAVHSKSKSRKSAPAAPIDPESIAVSRPKRRAAVHKRRMLEELLAPSDEEDEEENVPYVVHREETMDMRVTEDKVIVHEPVSASVAGPLAPTYVQQHVCDDEEEEDIDIMD